MRVLLVSTYDLGRQPLGLASPAARLHAAGVGVRAVDTSREALDDADISDADAVAFYLPMHTATRLALPLIERVCAVNPSARVAAYGLYAPLNDAGLRERGVAGVFGPEDEAALVTFLLAAEAPTRPYSIGDRFVSPDRSVLLPLARYAALQLADGSRRVVGTTDATRGCKHLCRHCPIVPVYRGRFRAVPVDTVMADIASHVAQGAQHISFGDPDFFNGPTHATRLVGRLHREYPDLSYDVTIKVEHLLKHADLLPVLRDTGCLFVTSAVESVDDAVLARLQKGHTRADFVRAVTLCREARLTLAPTFVPFTPWTTLEGYRDLLGQILALDLVSAVAPIQLGIRLLVTAESALLELPEVRALVGAFDPVALVWPWRHDDARVDALQREVMRIASDRSREDAFAAIAAAAGLDLDAVPAAAPATGRHATPPYMTEAWYCCAEPGPELLETV
jgi:radical SAM superfamily enzyme YgiQ (UPF0313 family)